MQRVLALVSANVRTYVQTYVQWVHFPVLHDEVTAVKRTWLKKNFEFPGEIRKNFKPVQSSTEYSRHVRVRRKNVLECSQLEHVCSRAFCWNTMGQKFLFAPNLHQLVGVAEHISGTC